MTDAWHTLKQFTHARIAQGRSGCGSTTRALLDFQLAHAAARDAVLKNWDFKLFAQQLEDLGLTVHCLNSAVSNRIEYLQRPDKGRCLDQASIQLLESSNTKHCDIAIVLSNGLSSTAVELHSLALLQEIIAIFNTSHFKLSPIYLVPNARVAISDEIGQLLKAKISLILLGERPGLSAADSMGIYFTYAPEIGKTDEQRNCLSNIRPPTGLDYQQAAIKLHYLCIMAFELGLSGVNLKDDMPTELLQGQLQISLK